MAGLFLITRFISYNGWVIRVEEEDEGERDVERMLQDKTQVYEVSFENLNI